MGKVPDYELRWSRLAVNTLCGCTCPSNIVKIRLSPANPNVCAVGLSCGHICLCDVNSETSSPLVVLEPSSQASSPSSFSSVCCNSATCSEGDAPLHDIRWSADGGSLVAAHEITIKCYVPSQSCQPTGEIEVPTCCTCVAMPHRQSTGPRLFVGDRIGMVKEFDFRRNFDSLRSHTAEDSTEIMQMLCSRQWFDRSGGITSVELSSTDTLMSVVRGGCFVSTIEVERGWSVQNVHMQKSHTVSCATPSPNATGVFCVAPHGEEMSVWPIVERTCASSPSPVKLQNKSYPPPEDARTPKKLGSTNNGCWVSVGEEERVVAAKNDGIVRIWEVNSGNCEQELSQPSTKVATNGNTFVDTLSSPCRNLIYVGEQSNNQISLWRRPV